MRKFRQGLFLAAGFGVAGLGILLPELAWGQGEGYALVAQAKEISETDFETIQIEGRLDSSSQKLDDDDTYFNVHTFEGQAGEQIVIDLVSSEFDAYLLLSDPEGNKIAEDNDGGDDSNARVVVTLTATGTYEIVVNTYKPEELGNYTLNLRAALPEDIELAEAKRLNQQVLQFYREGKYSEAIPLAEQALAIRQRILGQQHRDVASSLNNLARLYKSQGRYEEAEPLYRQALEMRKQLLGQQHRDVASSLNNLAGLYESQGRYEEAIPLAEQALAIRQRILGQQHRDVASSLNNLAGLYKSQGRYEEAEPLYRQAEERFLVKNYAFTYLTSGRDLLKLTNSNPSQEPPLIIANPNFEVPAEIASLDNEEAGGEEVERLTSSIDNRSIDISQIPSPSLPGTKDEGEAIGK